jgi:hypothetical protein
MMKGIENPKQALGLQSTPFHGALVYAPIISKKHAFARHTGPDAPSYLRGCPENRP